MADASGTPRPKIAVKLRTGTQSKSRSRLPLAENIPRLGVSCFIRLAFLMRRMGTGCPKSGQARDDPGASA